jgi:hypothetical protein
MAPLYPRRLFLRRKDAPGADRERCSDRAASRNAMAARFLPFRTRRDVIVRLLS